MSRAGWSIVTGGTVALAAGVAKTVLGAKAHANGAIDLQKLRLSFDGVSATAVPVLCEICAATFATNAPGTGSTSVTPALMYGRSTTVGWTAAKNWTAEPTVLTVVEELLISPNSMTYPYDWPLQQTIDTPLGEGLVLRCNAPAAVNVRATMVFERC